MSLRDSDARKVLTVVSDLADVEDEPLTLAVLRELPKLVPGEVCASNTVGITRPPSVDVVLSPDDAASDAVARYREHVREDPFVAQLAPVLTTDAAGRFANGMQALRLSDLLPLRAWTGTGLYQEVYRPWAITHQLSGVVDVHGTRVRSYAVLRGKRDFTDRERDIFTFLLGELARLHRRADGRAWLRTLAAASHEAARTDTRAVAAVDPEGTVIPLNARAAELVAVRDLREHPQLRRVATDPGAQAVAAIVHIQLAEASLRVHVLPSTDSDLRCLLVFHDDRNSQATARRYRLTNRERGVLSLIADGHTADAVARRLQLSPRTVQKYLERAYSKLDVHDRLSAVLRAKQLGILD